MAAIDGGDVVTQLMHASELLIYFHNIISFIVSSGQVIPATDSTMSSSFKTMRQLLTLGVGRVDGLWESLLETLWGHLLDSLGDEGWASGVRDRSLVLGRVGVVDLRLRLFKWQEHRNQKGTHRVRESVLESLGSLLLDGVGDNRLALGVDGVGLVGGRHGWLGGWFVCLVGSVEVEIEVGMRNPSVGKGQGLYRLEGMGSSR